MSEADALSTAEANQISLEFLLLDTDSDGKLNIDQLGTLLRSVGLFPSQVEVQSMLSMVDPDNTGFITQEKALQVVSLLRPQRTSEEELREALRVLDDDNDGFISATELRHILVNLGVKITKSEADEIIEDVEKDEENLINTDDLVTMLMMRDLGDTVR